MNILIVGAGLSGATAARRLAENGHEVHVIDKRDHIGGNVFDFVDDKTGIRLSKYGAHIFHTNNEDVWQFVNRFSEWTPYEHRVMSLVGEQFVPVPVNIDTVNALFDKSITTTEEMEQYLQSVSYKGEIKNSEDAALARVGKDLYDLMFKPYTIKQWDLEPKELEPSVLERIPVRNDYYDRYFSDTYEGLPKDGYTAFVENMVDHPNIVVELNTAYEDSSEYDITIFTGKIDDYFNDKYGKLEYRSLIFDYITIDTEDYQPTAVVNYPSLDYAFTRVIDYKKFYPVKTDKSIIAIEYSTDKGEPYYPVPTQKNRDIYAKYQQEALKLEEKGIYFVGRLAEYKYFNMDKAIESALLIADKIQHNS